MVLGGGLVNNVPCMFKVIFMNKASRPYSFHLHGVYDRNQGVGTHAYASSAPTGVPGEALAPGEARTYNWRITRTQGPTDSEFDCKTGTYYSTVDKVWMVVLLPLYLYSQEGMKSIICVSRKGTSIQV